MNATSLAELRAAAGARGAADEKMEQVRELLIGDTVRTLNARMAGLEARLRELDQTVASQVQAISARIERLAADSGSERRTAFDDLSRSVLELGERIGRIARP
jgi:outer membrane murein-binding lipoprotein Lpp